VDFPDSFFFLQKTTIQHFTEICPVGAVFIHAEGHVDGQIEEPDENKRHFLETIRKRLKGNISTRNRMKERHKSKSVHLQYNSVGLFLAMYY
jgi:hypothetical protein